MNSPGLDKWRATSLIAGMEHDCSSSPTHSIKPTGLPPRILPGGPRAHSTDHHWPITRRCHGRLVTQTTRVWQLGAAGNECLQNVLTIVLYPANQTVLKVRVRQFIRILQRYKKTQLNKLQMLEGDPNLHCYVP